MTRAESNGIRTLLFRFSCCTLLFRFSCCTLLFRFSCRSLLFRFSCCTLLFRFSCCTLLFRFSCCTLLFRFSCCSCIQPVTTTHWRAEADLCAELSLAGAATGIYKKNCRDKHGFVATSILLSRQKTCFIATKLCLYFCRDKNMFVATSIVLSQQRRVLSRQRRGNDTVWPFSCTTVTEDFDIIQFAQ